MAHEKTYTELIDEAHYREHLGHPIQIHSPRKYRKNGTKRSEEQDEKFEDVEIGSGTRVILQQKSGADVVGYMLATVIDLEDNLSYWDDQTAFIVEVLEVSNEKLQEHVGRLRSTRLRGHWWPYGKQRCIVDVGKKNWPDYQVSE